MIIAFIKYKAGTGGTTCAGWLAQALYERGSNVAGMDADPALHWREWAEDVSEFPYGVAIGNLFRPARDDEPAPVPLREQITDMASYADHVIVDAPQYADHSAQVVDVLRVADVAIVPLMPSTSEVRRQVRLKLILDEADKYRPHPLQRLVLLNRTKPAARSTEEFRAGFRARGWPVASVMIPDWEDYRQSIGAAIEAKGSHFDELVTEMGWA